MAVYERTYRRYTGELTPQQWRFLVLPRYAYEEVFKSRIFVIFLALCFIPPLVDAVIIYLHHNLSALQAIQLPLAELIPIDGSFFATFVVEMQSVFALFLALAVGPGLISADVRNNALPLYLSRPLSRGEYVLGKLSVLLILLSAVTWVPGILLFLLQGYLEGFSWLAGNLRIGAAIFLSCWSWILALSLLTLALSAWVKWKPVTRILLLAVIFVFRGWAEAINALLDTRWGGMVSLLELNDTVRDGLFGLQPESGLPVWSGWAGLAVAAFLCLALLARRVRAYEVVR